MADTTIWISGAAYGIGAGLARHCPHPDARIINLDREAADNLETVRFDLTKPETWDDVSRHFEAELGKFKGKRALFLLVGHAHIAFGLASRVDIDAYRQALIANGVGPLMLGLSFLRALPREVEGGLMIMSSGAAHFRLEGQSAYCAAKAGIEHWVRVISKELRDEGRKHWVVAVRPGLVDTPTSRAASQADPALLPRVARMRENLATIGVDIDTAAKRIWAALPPAPKTAIISFDEDPAGAVVR